MWTILAVFLSLSQLAFAAEVCVTIDDSLWTAAQRDQSKIGPAYKLAFEAGQNILPNVSGNVICFLDPLFDVPTTITPSAMLSKIQASIDLNNQVIAEEQELLIEVSSNDLCTASLTEISDRIDAKVAALQAQLDATTTNAQVKAHLRNDLYPALGTVFRKLGKCLRARAR